MELRLFISCAAIESYRDDQPDYFPGELIDSWFVFFGLGLYHCYKIMFDQSSCVDAPFRDMILVVKSDLGSDFVNMSFNLEGIRDSLTVNLKYIGVIHLSREQVIYWFSSLKCENACF